MVRTAASTSLTNLLEMQNRWPPPGPTDPETVAVGPGNPCLHSAWVFLMPAQVSYPSLWRIQRDLHSQQLIQPPTQLMTLQKSLNLAVLPSYSIQKMAVISTTLVQTCCLTQLPSYIIRRTYAEHLVSSEGALGMPRCTLTLFCINLGCLRK